jgi:hypothetical protein
LRRARGFALWRRFREASVLFLKKKNQKTLARAANRRLLAAGLVQEGTDKSFLVHFFKKELLSFLSCATLVG